MRCDVFIERYTSELLLVAEISRIEGVVTEGVVTEGGEADPSVVDEVITRAKMLDDAVCDDSKLEFIIDFTELCTELTLTGTIFISTDIMSGTAEMGRMLTIEETDDTEDIVLDGAEDIVLDNAEDIVLDDFENIELKDTEEGKSDGSENMELNGVEYSELDDVPSKIVVLLAMIVSSRSDEVSLVNDDNTSDKEDGLFKEELVTKETLTMEEVLDGEPTIGE